MEFDDWRVKARALLHAGIPPAEVHWDDPQQGGLFASPPADPAHGGAVPVTRIPARLLPVLEAAACHRTPGRHALMYRVLWRVTHGEADLLDDATDDDAAPLLQMQRDVRRDTHKMTAFVRFREVRERADDVVRWIAWYAPSHRILRRTAPFFVKRFGTMLWTIATPDGVATWDRVRLRFLPPDPAAVAPSEDAGEALWLTYYRAIFNPARLNVRAMQKEMPQKYWMNLPEARLIPELVAGAAHRAGTMVETVPQVRVQRASLRKGAAAPVHGPGPAEDDSLDACRRCDLWERATQAVPGTGPAAASLMLVGEQPGDEEDLQGRAFVGPAGKLLRRALAEAGIDVAQVYVTNAVKHFSWEPRGKRRIHKTPGQRAIAACRGWLEEEISRVRPAVIVALGTTALQALLQERHAIADARGRRLHHHAGAEVVGTYHPAAVLRAVDAATGRTLQAALLADLRRAAALASAAPASPAR